MSRDWLTYVNERRRQNLLHILEELSRLQNSDNLNFIIIGALPLLMEGYLRYAVLWDIDLLFRDKQRLGEFIALPKSPTLRIINYDEDLMVSKSIASFHTAWAFDKAWFNVDYILKKNIFEFFRSNRELEPYKQTITLAGKNFHIHINCAHPWDIIVEKALSPRTEKELDLKIDMSVDIRHILSVYNKEKENIHFWNHVLDRAAYLHKRERFKEMFLNILSLAPDLGYQEVDVSPRVKTMLGAS
jgi:hypothetical protein